MAQLCVPLVFLAIVGCTVAQTSVPASCTSLGISTKTECATACSDTLGHAYQSSNGAVTCVCYTSTTTTTNTVCSDGFSDTADDDAGAYVDDTTKFLQDALVGSVGEQCRESVTKALSSDVVECVYSEISNPNSVFANLEDLTLTTQSQFDQVCKASGCLRKLFSAFGELTRAGCLSDSDDDFFNDDGSSSISADGSTDTLSAFQQFEAAEQLLTLFCTVSSNNGMYCGQLLNSFDDELDDDGGTVTLDQTRCQTIVEYGNCLGSIINLAVTHSELLDLKVTEADRDTFVNNLNSQCMAANVPGVASAAAGTEAPADLASSSASSVRGWAGASLATVAAAAAAAAAALLA